MTEWHRRWDEGRIGFHRDEVNAHLQKNLELFPEKGRVLVPLCGKSVDMPFLAGKGMSVVGVELVQKAVEEYFQERGIEPEVDGAI